MIDWSLCGRENPDDARFFCNGCGAALAVEGADAQLDLARTLSTVAVRPRDSVRSKRASRRSGGS